MCESYYDEFNVISGRILMMVELVWVVVKDVMVVFIGVDLIIVECVIFDDLKVDLLNEEIECCCFDLLVC